MEPTHELVSYASRFRRLTAGEYMRMVETGIFSEHERLELLDGVLCEVGAQGGPDARVIQVLSRLMFRRFAEYHELRVQLPLQLGEHSVPEPDLAVVTREEGARRDSYPRHALLVVEVARGCLREERETKGSLYARYGVPEFWLVDVERRRVEVYRQPEPEGGTWAEHVTLGGSEVLVCQSVPELRIPLQEVWWE